MKPETLNKTYPLLPLRDTVVFPGNVSSLFVGRDRSMEAVRIAMDGTRFLALVTQRNSDVVTPVMEDLYETGVLAEILQLLKMPDGTYKILVEGVSRLSILRVSDLETHQEAEVSHIREILPESGSRESEILLSGRERLLENFQKFNQERNLVSRDLLDELSGSRDSGTLVDSVAHALPLPYDHKQTILATLPVVERLQLVLSSLDNQLDLNQLESDIQERVRSQLDKMQRQYYLNEQMKVIREELGDTDPDEFESYRQRLDAAGLPEEARTKASQELRRLEKMPPMSAESTVIRNYLDWILDLPWSALSAENHDLAHAEEVLSRSHYGLDKIKDRILEFIAVRQLAPEAKGPILCLVGPPGVGKTSLARTLAECLGRKFARIALGGVRDEAEIRGHRRTYIGALPGRLISTLAKVKVRNPVLLLDEIDKLSSDYRGNPGAALLEVLDAEQNREFHDHYLELPFDLSQVLFLATANVVHDIPEPLRDRLEIIELSSYTEVEKIQIARRYLLPRQIQDTGISDVSLSVPAKSLAFVIRHYTKEAGVRQLDREIAKITRKTARLYLEHKRGSSERLELELDRSRIVQFLGPMRYDYNRREKDGVIGQVHGLAWTAAGGDILNIETALAYGKGALSITGNLGDVMKESASAALGYVRSQSHMLGLPSDFFEKNDIFVHVPDGSIPKDGPSAGITIATALISAVTQKPVLTHIAMTGEVTLRGVVLPIGGLKEKALAAYRGGITEIIIPRDNEKDIEEVPPVIRERLKFHPVENMRQVVRLAIADGAVLFDDKTSATAFYSRSLNLSTPDLRIGESGTVS